MARIGEFGNAHPADETLTFGFFGEDFRVDPAFGELDLADFFEQARAIDDRDPTAIVFVKDMLRSCVHPDDFAAFYALARKHRQGIEDLMSIVMAVVEAVAERPTRQPSVSTDGHAGTGPSSESARRVLSRLDGRPDLQLMVTMAQEQQAASA